MKNAHAFPAVFEDLGVDLRELGCLMLDTKSPIIGIAGGEEDAYVSPDPKKFWMRGVATDWHVTARYGFLPDVRKRHVDEVLAGIPVPLHLRTAGFEVFPSPYADEEYECLVVRVEDKHLTEINAQLSVLPNVSTFVEYKPHITVGYYRKGFYEDNKAALDGALYTSVETIGWNYGHILCKD